MAWPEAGGIDVSLEVKSHTVETKKFKRYETMVQRAFGTQINAWVFFFMCIPAGKVSRALGTRVSKQKKYLLLQ